MATPGKLVTGLHVVGVRGNRPHLFQLFLRHTIKSLSSCAALNPLICMLTCNRRQLVHDRIAGTAVDLRSPPVAITDPGRASIAVPAIGRTASIYQRIVAAVLDGIVFCVAETLFPLIACELVMYAEPCPGAPAIALSVGAMLISAFVPILSFAAFESSPLKATPGKLVAAIQVVDKSGQRLSYFQALTKQIVQGLVYMSLLPVFWLIFLTAIFCIKPTTTYAMRWFLAPYCGFYLSYGMLLCMTFGKGQTVIDRLSDRWVIREPAGETLSGRLSTNSGEIA
jgi:uncharacterized RDD family membrane protein YckC